MKTFAGRPATASFDAAAPNECDGKVFRHLVLARFRALTRRDSGFPARDDFEAIYKIEDALEALTCTAPVRYAGRLATAEGEYIFLIYTTTPDATAALEALFREHPDREPAFQRREEPDWVTYRELLYPDDEQWRAIKDVQVLENLQKHGDDLTKPRQVDHWLYFRTRESRDLVAETLRKWGFTVVGESAPDALSERWSLQVARVDSVQEASILQLTNSLHHLARDHGGDYDGWETSVERDA